MTLERQILLLAAVSNVGTQATCKKGFSSSGWKKRDNCGWKPSLTVPTGLSAFLKKITSA